MSHFCINLLLQFFPLRIKNACHLPSPWNLLFDLLYLDCVCCTQTFVQETQPIDYNCVAYFCRQVYLQLLCIVWWAFVWKFIFFAVMHRLFSHIKLFRLWWILSVLTVSSFEVCCMVLMLMKCVAVFSDLVGTKLHP